METTRPVWHTFEQGTRQPSRGSEGSPSTRGCEPIVRRAGFPAWIMPFVAGESASGVSR
jgi:hypothetical protein